MTDVDLVRRMCSLVELGVPLYCAANSVGYTRRRFEMLMRVGQEDAYSNRDTDMCKCYIMIMEAKGRIVKELVNKIKEAGETDWKANTYLLERIDAENFGPTALQGNNDVESGITIITDIKPNENLLENKEDTNNSLTDNSSNNTNDNLILEEVYKNGCDASK